MNMITKTVRRIFSMGQTTNNRLNMVYNGNETIMNAGFTMKSNFALPLLSRMVDEGLINHSASTVVQTILQYKHTEDNPFPSRDEIARLLGKSVSYVKKALNSIKDAGVLAIEKAGRNNTYSFKPFFSLLEKFIVEYKDNKNYKVKISELLNVSVQKKEEQDFSWSENYTGEKEVIKDEEVSEFSVEEKEDDIQLPEEIMNTALHNEVNDTGMKAIEKAYNTYSGKIDDIIFMEKISYASYKDNFINYFNTCIANAYINKEQPKQKSSKQKGYPNNNIKQTNKEVIPEWFEDKDKSKKYKSNPEKIAESTFDGLKNLKSEFEEFMSLDIMKGNDSLKLNLKQVNARLNDLSLTVEQIEEITL